MQSPSIYPSIHLSFMYKEKWKKKKKTQTTQWNVDRRHSQQFTERKDRHNHKKWRVSSLISDFEHVTRTAKSQFYADLTGEN